MIRSMRALSQTTPSSSQSLRSGTSSRISIKSASSSTSKRYSVKSNRNSKVDELLFGSIKKQSNNNNQSKNSYVLKSNILSLECNPHHQIVRVVSPSSVRNLYAKNDTNKERTLRITQPHLNRMLGYTAADENDEDYKKKQYRESVERRQQFAKFDKIRILRESNSDLQKVQEEEARNLIRRAWEDRVEHESEVKEIKNMIKAAAVQTILDKQVKEKELSKRLQLDENERLNKLVEAESDASFMKQKEIDMIRLEKEHIGAHFMIKQMEDNRNIRLKELDLLADENVKAKLEAEKRITDHMMTKQMSMMLQRKRRDEYVTANKDIAERKSIEKAKEKLFDEQIMRIQFEKGEKERIKEEEIVRKRFEREKEYARMRALQERIQDLQSQRDELLERRAAEETQRKWRERELKEEMKKRESEHELTIIRAVQKHMAILRNANEASRDKEIFDNFYKKEKLLLEKDKLEERTKQNKKHLYAKALAQQMEQRKVQNIVDNYRKRIEEEAVLKERATREERINEAKLRILEESRSSGVAEKYLLQIEKRINNPVTFIRH